MTRSSLHNNLVAEGFYLTNGAYALEDESLAQWFGQGRGEVVTTGRSELAHDNRRPTNADS